MLYAIAITLILKSSAHQRLQWGAVGPVNIYISKCPKRPNCHAYFSVKRSKNSQNCCILGIQFEKKSRTAIVGTPIRKVCMELISIG